MREAYRASSIALTLHLGGKGFIHGIQPALSTVDLNSLVFILTNMLVTMHQIVRAVNKLQRSLLSTLSFRTLQPTLR